MPLLLLYRGWLLTSEAVLKIAFLPATFSLIGAWHSTIRMERRACVIGSLKSSLPLFLSSFLGNLFTKRFIS